VGNQIVRCEGNLVRYQFEGFFMPIRNIPGWNYSRAGRDVRLRFSLTGDYGLDVFASGNPRSAAINCRTAEVEGAWTEAQTVDFTYHRATDRYWYTWGTDPAWARTCRQLVFGFNDGSEQRVNFNFWR
jgi:hypothetical protein